MTSADLAASAPQTPPERRQRWIALLALVPVIPLTLYMAGRESWSEYRRTVETAAIVVPAGQGASYNGASVSAVEATVVSAADNKALPPNSAFVRVRYLVALERDAGTDWLECRTALTNAKGERWLAIRSVPSVVRSLVTPPGNPAAPACTTLGAVQPKAGTRVTIDEIYYLPQDRLADIRPTFSAAGGRPSFLQFTMPGGR